MKTSISRRSLVAGGSARAENGVTDSIIRIGQSAVFSLVDLEMYARDGHLRR